MRLNKKGRDDYRKEMDKFLNTIEFDPNKRIVLSEEDLEELLFDRVGDHKVIGYFTKNLCKLDLSKVSFENVDFGTRDNCKIKDFSNTNINIDFSKLCLDGWAKYTGTMTIANANFENVDLSNNDLYSISTRYYNRIEFLNCNMKNTKLEFRYIDDYSCSISFKDCDLSNNDLSDGMINWTKDYWIGYWGVYSFSRGCIFKNTGMLFKIEKDCTEKDIKTLFESDRIEGCDIEVEIIDPITGEKLCDKFIHIDTEKQREDKKKKILCEYEKFKKEYIVSKIEEAEAQVHLTKKN